MNDLQKVEFNMLKEFIRICDELNIKYYLVCGSALGAAKYSGFIPWDDDMDVALPRKDYEIFCDKAQEMLPKNLFLQNYHTDKNYPLIFSKIRNSDTTYIENSYSDLNINHGVYIDVFPLDGYPEKTDEIQWVEKEKRRYLFSRLCCLNVKRTFKTRLLVILEKLFLLHKNPAKFINRLEKVITSYSTDNSELWCNHGNWQGKLEYAPREQYGEGIIVKFEGIDVRIPELYDEYLTQKYGDWRADLPDEEKVGHHYYQIMDLSRPYTDYIGTVTNNGTRIKLRKDPE